MTDDTAAKLVTHGRPGSLRCRYLLGCLLLLAGCGQTGPLYLPDTENNVEISETAPAVD